ncbi:MAG TPA: DUF4160 domain-containing protein [Phototrophicaceae bacterium]|nr:DUF4160 domain-containing protein [Phototrophicaceae bacterium]
MPTVHQEAGCNFKINTNDHTPAHVHVYVGSGVVQIYLDDHATVKYKSGVSISDVQKAQRITLANQGKLLKAWKTIHGEV